MKVAALANPVRRSWIADQGFRLDPGPYLSGGYEARMLLAKLNVRKEPLQKLTAGHDGGIYNGPKFSRAYVFKKDQGVPFVGSTDMLEADFSWLPLLKRSDALAIPYLQLQPGTSLISCSGTVGRLTYVRRDMSEYWSSQHIMKVVPDADLVPPGFLYTYLRSKFGVPLITGAAYGAIVQHIEPHHIADLPVPRFSVELESEIHDLVQQAAGLRARFQVGVVAATQDLFISAGLPQLVDLQWHEQPRDLGFQVRKADATSLRALNYAPRVRRILDVLRSVPHRTLGEVCDDGQLSRGQRFRRVDSDPEHGIRLIGQRQGFWLRPEGRWISLSSGEAAGVKANDETTMIASQGTHGENEVFCRGFFVTGSWQRDFAFSEHFLRVLPGREGFPGAYLFAFLRSEALFRVLRSMSTGSKQQDIHEVLRRDIPVPECTPQDRARIAETIRQAYRDRDHADELEDRALALLDCAVREAGG